MPKYRADCSRCCGLCCVVPAQLTDQGFPTNKCANTPCPKLDRSHRCSIHSSRRLRGYAACESFDCFGAGQWITQQLFAGAEWSDSREVANRMFDAWRYWAPRFEAAALIEAALPHIRKNKRARMMMRMAELTSGETPGPIDSADGQRIRDRTLAEIRSALRIRKLRSPFRKSKSTT